MTDGDVRLARIFGDVARFLLTEPDLDATLARVLEVTLQLMPAVEHIGIELVEGRQIGLLAASSDVAWLLDQIELDLDEGPCLDALRENEVFMIDDLESEARWPRFAAEAVRRTDVRSVLALRLFVADATIGALNLYSTDKHAFDQRSEAIGCVLAAHAGLAVYTARHRAQMEEALATRDLIGQAKGMIMARLDVGAGDAFGLITEISQRRNMKAREVAQRIVDAGGPIEFD